MLNLLKRLLRHLTPLRRFQLLALALTMLTASVAELLTIGAVIPFIGILTNPGSIRDQWLVRALVIQFDLHNHWDFQFAIFVVFVLAVLMASGLRLLLVWMQARITIGIVNELATAAFDKVLRQPYSLHISRHSSEVVSGILNKIGLGLSGTLDAVLSLVVALFILLSVLSALIVYDPIFALSSFAGFGAVYGMVVALTKRRLTRYSEQVNFSSTQLVKILQEGLGGIRDVLLDSSQSIHSAAYRQMDTRLRQAQRKIQVISAGPRFAIETLGIVMIAVVAFTLSSKEGGLIALIPTIGALVIGAQRILPLLQQSYSSWALMMGNRDRLHDALDLLDQPIGKDRASVNEVRLVSFDREIRLKNVSFRYEPSAPAVLKELSFRIAKGVRLGFVGQTGCGKSTLIDVIIGLLSPTEGCLLIDGKKIDAANCHDWWRHIAHVPQSIFLADVSVAENIAMGIPRNRIDMDRVRFAAQRAHIAETIESWPEQYETNVGERGIELSGGQRQRIGIARALYKQADVIILDEATSALDNKTEQTITQAIEALGRDITILTVAHRLTALDHCSEIYELRDGKLKRIRPAP